MNLNQAQLFPLEEQTNPKDLLGVKKLDLTVLPDVAIAHASHAMMNGAQKYGPYNWREKKVRADIYIAAARRHISQWFDGEECAEDSCVHHLGHAMACLAILLDAQEYGCLIDNRPPGSSQAGFGRVLAEINKGLGETK